MLDTLSREMDFISDTDGAIRDGMEVLALAWNRREQGLPNTLDHDDLTKLRLIVNSYMEAMETLPERVMVRAHRMTEKRMYKILNGQKQEGDIVTYGNPAVNLNRVAEQWSLYLAQKYEISIPINFEDVCWMMSDLKKSRQMHRGKRDNIVDALGYIALIDRCRGGGE
jgi:hypothetical protein